MIGALARVHVGHHLSTGWASNGLVEGPFGQALINVIYIPEVVEPESKIPPPAPALLKGGSELAEGQVVLPDFLFRPPMFVSLDRMAPIGDATPHRGVLQPVDKLLQYVDHWVGNSLSHFCVWVLLDS